MADILSRPRQSWHPGTRWLLLRCRLCAISLLLLMAAQIGEQIGWITYTTCSFVIVRISSTPLMNWHAPCRKCPEGIESSIKMKV